MAETISFNTEELAKPILAPVEPLKTYKLVSDDHPIMHKRLEEFDFKNPPINPNELASTLVETCKKNKGMGLSANQCGFEHRVFVMGANDDFVAFFNPKLEAISKEEVHLVEGCLSFPFLSLHITRPKIINVSYQDFNGEEHKATFDGLSARCFLHELDHLEGVVFTQRAKPLALQMSLKKQNKMMKKMGLK